MHENICVQAKAEGMDNMWKLGFDFVLARDMTDAFTGYDPTTTWLNPEYVQRSRSLCVFSRSSWNAAAQQRNKPGDPSCPFLLHTS